MVDDGDVATPMTCPYFRAISPAAMRRVAILCPMGIESSAVMPSAEIRAPFAMRTCATATLSAGCSRTASALVFVVLSNRKLSEIDMLVWTPRLNISSIRVPVLGF